MNEGECRMSEDACNLNSGLRLTIPQKGWKIKAQTPMVTKSGVCMQAAFIILYLVWIRTCDLTNLEQTLYHCAAQNSTKKGKHITTRGNPLQNSGCGLSSSTTSSTPPTLHYHHHPHCTYNVVLKRASCSSWKWLSWELDYLKRIFVLWIIDVKLIKWYLQINVFTCVFL